MMATPTLAVAPEHDRVADAVAAVRAHPLWHSNDGPEALLELRLDRMADASASTLAAAAAALGAHRLIATCRSVAEGGGRDGRELHGPKKLRALYAAALRLGVRFVDVELQRLDEDAALRQLIAQGCGAGVSHLVASHHGPAPLAAAQLRALASAAAALQACAFKVVLDLGTAALAHGAFAAWAQEPQPLAVLPIALGAAGLYSRLLVGRQLQPPPYTLVRLDAGLAVAPGQPRWCDAAQLYRVAAVTRRTQVFGVVGSPIGHSRSPELHAAAIAGRGLDAVYLPFEVPGPLDAWLAQVAPHLGLRGLSVTAPHKQAALAAAASSTEAAARVGAANTLVLRPDGAWHADNTDGPAALAVLAPQLAGGVKGSRVLVLGTGGAARAVCWALAQAGAQVEVWGRRGAAAAALATALGGPPAVTAVAEAHLAAALGRAQALVHCTPVGMAGAPGGEGASLLTGAQLGLLQPGAVVFDTVYAPEPTALMRLARAAQPGAAVFGGAAMLEQQAWAQFRLFYGA